MNDYEMMNQRVDKLREELSLLQREEDWVRAKKAAVMDELLDTRRQILRADRARYALLEGESSPAPCDLDQTH